MNEALDRARQYFRNAVDVRLYRSTTLVKYEDLPWGAYHGAVCVAHGDTVEAVQAKVDRWIGWD